MGDLFGAFQKVSPQNKNNSFDQIAAYEEYYMKLLKRYQGDIQNIEEMMENLRKERKDFYLKELPKEIFNLINLEKLSIDCNNLEISPDGIEKLINLEKLYIEINIDINIINKDFNFKSLPIKEIGKLNNLKDLSIRIRKWEK